MAVTCAGVAVAVAVGRKAALANRRSSCESTLETIALAVLSHPSALTREYHHHACASSCPDAGPASVWGGCPRMPHLPSSRRCRCRQSNTSTRLR